MVKPASIPKNYLCPITQEIMEDPVVAADGFTYERKAIMLWLERNDISWATEKKLKHKDLVTNDRLASEISKFNEKNPSPDSLEDKAVTSIVQCLENKRLLIAQLRISIVKLTAVQEDLSEHLLNCKISNTAGNSASIAGTGILFTPLALIGIVTIIAGSLTSIGTNVTQFFIEKSLQKRMKKIIKEEEKAKFRYEVSQMKSQYFIGLMNFGTNCYQVGSRIWKIMKYAQLFEGLKATNMTTKSVLGIGGWSSAAAACKGTKFALSSAFGAGLSAVDIIITWTFKNSTLEQFKIQIDNREKHIELYTKELEDWEKSLPNEWKI
ncbi:unnamed protein product [Blepharisma stoltei]|uniref:U-box domain-containing protein n=1 Tax=Blepharisma stoltei TaxID=1481888 RepID=A0AAU9J4B8_9CILI|nr:unnamed protein product [Blepharisma stoltei]